MRSVFPAPHCKSAALERFDRLRESGAGLFLASSQGAPLSLQDVRCRYKVGTGIGVPILALGGNYHEKTHRRSSYASVATTYAECSHSSERSARGQRRCRENLLGQQFDRLQELSWR